MKKVSVIGMDMGDKNHKAVGLSEDGEIIDRAEVPCTPEDVRAYLKRHPARCWRSRPARTAGGCAASGWSRGTRFWWATRASCG